ncbi:hypothetical protein F1D05_22395 [Kribbella qitaiheensis]|uniref:Uncharacterized protein n=1 Tax=Kribbella qitaiheensis TaxID=1544730 RepID=A0A7G6X1N9_9ACTN|nr:hypothetical protein [Kribbella qitaiheensis]QNE20154.1 hypothetical protein F1D05_22395 [Kribbella qitaiheensis]
MKQSRTSGRAVRLTVTGVAVAAAAGLAITGVAVAGTDKPADAGLPAAVGVPEAAAAPKAAAMSKFVFQNGPQAVGTLAANGSVEVGAGLTFQTRGTQWALVNHLPGEATSFGWRATVGNDNIGDGTKPGIQSTASRGTIVVSSVFSSKKVATVVYTSGTKAWYAKVERLGGIPGWVGSNAVLNGAMTTKTVTRTPGLTGNDVAVFVYDAAGKLLVKFPDNAENPLKK